MPFSQAAAAAARGEFVPLLAGTARVTVHNPGVWTAFDIDVKTEAPIELHSHRATLVVIPIEFEALETGAHLPRFVGSIELSCPGERTFDVVLEGEFDEPVERIADVVPPEEVLEALLDQLADRIERHVVATDPTLGIPF